MTLIQIKKYGLGEVNPYTEIMNSSGLLHLLGIIHSIILFQSIHFCFICSYGFTADKLICLGFIERPKSDKIRRVTAEYILSKDAKYQVDIAGYKFSLIPYLHAPHIASASQQSQRYKPTVVNYKSDIVR